MNDNPESTRPKYEFYPRPFLIRVIIILALIGSILLFSDRLDSKLKIAMWLVVGVLTVINWIDKARRRREHKARLEDWERSQGSGD